MKKEIKLISVTEKLSSYLNLFNTKDIGTLTLDQGNFLFTKIIEDFRSGNLTLDELSVFGSKIFHGVAKVKGEGSDLFFASLSAMDLGFEIRQVYGNVPQHMKDIDEFFEKYKR